MRRLATRADWQGQASNADKKGRISSFTYQEIERRRRWRPDVLSLMAVNFSQLRVTSCSVVVAVAVSPELPGMNFTSLRARPRIARSTTQWDSSPRHTRDT